MIYPWQQSQWQQVNQLISADRLPHALFLQGNQGLGKAGFAFSLAKAMLCKQPADDKQACGTCPACKLFDAGTHPDLHYLKPVAKKNSTSKKPALSIRIENVRDLCEKLNQTSQYSGYRVAIIEQADQLTISAANSLLKTLEEPGRDVLIILISARFQRLPATIRSRCQLMRFTVPDENLSLAWIKQNSDAQEQPSARPDDKQIKEALKHAYGSPLSALKQLQDTEHHELIAEAMIAGISGKNSLDYSAKLAKLVKYQALEVMLTWVSDVTKLVSCGPDADIVNDQYRSRLQAIAKKANQQRLFRFYDQLNFNIQHSSIALNEQLLWENLLISWDSL